MLMLPTHPIGTIIDYKDKKYKAVRVRRDMPPGCGGCDLRGPCTLDPGEIPSGACSLKYRTDGNDIVWVAVNDDVPEDAPSFNAGLIERLFGDALGLHLTSIEQTGPGTITIEYTEDPLDG